MAEYKVKSELRPYTTLLVCSQLLERNLEKVKKKKIISRRQDTATFFGGTDAWVGASEVPQNVDDDYGGPTNEVDRSQ